MRASGSGSLDVSQAAKSGHQVNRLSTVSWLVLVASSGLNKTTGLAPYCPHPRKFAKPRTTTGRLLQWPRRATKNRGIRKFLDDPKAQRLAGARWVAAPFAIALRNLQGLATRPPGSNERSLISAGLRRDQKVHARYPRSECLLDPPRLGAARFPAHPSFVWKNSKHVLKTAAYSYLSFKPKALIVF